MELLTNMTKKVSNLNDHKNKRKYEYIRDDLDTILYLLKLIKTGIMDYSIYIPVRDVIISITENERKLLKHLDKINNKLEKLYEENTENLEKNNN